MGLPGRGVYFAPWLGPNGERVIIALDRAHHIVGEPRLVPVGVSHVIAGDEMWERLDTTDPVPTLI